MVACGQPAMRGRGPGSLAVMTPSSFRDSVVTCFRKYAVFTGLAPRHEYWWFFLFVVVGTFVTGYVDGLIRPPHAVDFATLGPLARVFTLVTVLPALAVGARRLHDIDRSGWWLLVQCVPLVGGLAPAVMCAGRGSAGANRFGAAPDSRADRSPVSVPTYPRP